MKNKNNKNITLQISNMLDEMILEGYNYPMHHENDNDYNNNNDCNYNHLRIHNFYKRKYNDMILQENRLKTFSLWKGNRMPNIKNELVEAGFFYIGKLLLFVSHIGYINAGILKIFSFIV